MKLREEMVADHQPYLVTWGQNVCKPVCCGACAISTYCPRIGVTKGGEIMRIAEIDNWD